METGFRIVKKPFGIVNYP